MFQQRLSEVKATWKLSPRKALVWWVDIVQIVQQTYQNTIRNVQFPSAHFKTQTNLARPSGLADFFKSSTLEDFFSFFPMTGEPVCLVLHRIRRKSQIVQEGQAGEGQ